MPLEKFCVNLTDHCWRIKHSRERRADLSSYGPEIVIFSYSTFVTVPPGGGVGVESIKLKGLDESMFYSLDTRKQYINVQHFDPMINVELPVNIREGGVIHNLICFHYMYEMDQESISAYGDELMNAGFLPVPQFIGTEFSDKVRYIGDFGSRIYHVKRNKE